MSSSSRCWHGSASVKLGEPHCFSALINDLSPESRERIERLLAQGFSLTQHTLARILDVKQAEISKIETRADIVVTWMCELSSPAAPARTGKENQPADRWPSRFPA